MIKLITIFWIIIGILSYYYIFIKPWVIHFKNLKNQHEQKSYNDMYNIHPSDFEHHIKDLLEISGYGSGTVSSYVNDFGVDVHLPNAVVQVKKYKCTSKVGRPELMKLEAARTYFKKEKAIFVTLSFYTSSAIDYAKKINMQLIDFNDIMNMKGNMPNLTDYQSIHQKIAKGFI